MQNLLKKLAFKKACLPEIRRSAEKKKNTKLKNHILEIKARIGYVSLSAFLAFILAYTKATQLTYIFLLSFEKESYSQKKFIFTDLSEAFSSTLSISILFSIFCVLPLLLYHSFSFLSPSWYLHERKKQKLQFVIAFLSWLSYIFFIQIHILPGLCRFLLKFQVKSECLSIAVEPRIIEYISWASTILFLAALIFLFFFFFYLNMEGRKINSKADWSKNHKLIFWLSLILSSLLSPPEIWSQFFLTCILYALCELLIWVRFVSKNEYK